MGIPSQDVLNKVYGEDAERAQARLSALAGRYDEAFGTGDPEFFTASGRTEIIGNHTDHNGGKILAASITMDSIAAAHKAWEDFIPDQGWKKSNIGIPLHPGAERYYKERGWM